MYCVGRVKFPNRLVAKEGCNGINAVMKVKAGGDRWEEGCYGPLVVEISGEVR